MLPLEARKKDFGIRQALCVKYLPDLSDKVFALLCQLELLVLIDQ